MDNWFGILSLVINVVLSTGFIVSIYTLKAQRKQANANADQAVASAKQTVATANTTEIDNLSRIAKEWREYAEEAEMRYSTMTKLMEAQIKTLSSDVEKLAKQLKQVLKIIKDMNHENLEKKKQEASEIAGG